MGVFFHRPKHILPRPLRHPAQSTLPHFQLALIRMIKEHIETMRNSHPARLNKTRHTPILHKIMTQRDKGKLNQRLIQLLVKDES